MGGMTTRDRPISGKPIQSTDNLSREETCVQILRDAFCRFVRNIDGLAVTEPEKRQSEAPLLVQTPLVRSTNRMYVKNA